MTSPKFSIDTLANEGADEAAEVLRAHQRKAALAVQKLLERTNDETADPDETAAALDRLIAACHPRAAELAVTNSSSASTNGHAPAALSSSTPTPRTHEVNGKMLRDDVTLQEALMLVAFSAPGDGEQDYPPHIVALQMLVRRNLDGPANRSYVELDESGYPRELLKLQNLIRSGEGKRNSNEKAAKKIRELLATKVVDAKSASPAQIDDGFVLTTALLDDLNVQVTSLEAGLANKSASGGTATN